jgi:hypothetical protein
VSEVLSALALSTDRPGSGRALCGELAKLEVDLNPANLIVLPVANSETHETTSVSHQVFATRDQSEMLSDGYRWRRWESNLLQTTLFRMIQWRLRGMVSRLRPR